MKYKWASFNLNELKGADVCISNWWNDHADQTCGVSRSCYYDYVFCVERYVAIVCQLSPVINDKQKGTNTKCIPKIISIRL